MEPFTWKPNSIGKAGLCSFPILPKKYSAIDHLEIHVEGGEPIPIKQTGFFSHCFGKVEPSLSEEELIQLVLNWIEEEAKLNAGLTPKPHAVMAILSLNSDHKGAHRPY